VDRARIALLQSCWHRDLVDRCVAGFRSQVAEDLPAASVEQFEVPGAFEIPLRAQMLAQSGRFDAVVAAGLVVDGGIYRHEFVANAVIGGLMRVQLDTGVPVFSAVLTPQQFHEHTDHVEFFADHLYGKGQEVARTCVETLRSQASLAS
jgi:6,7-dimethyl-8-ribityllumazine synthase